MNNRQNRKLAHINHALSLADQLENTGLQDVFLVHNALPELNLNELELGTYLWGMECSVPIYINAITGGTPDVEYINKRLAQIAKTFNLPMAVGSQTSALYDKKVINSYKIVRKFYPEGIVWGNIGAHIPPNQALEAIKMIEANGLQIHLNVPQELVMAEGDRCFKGYLKNIEQICSLANVPIIVKEVGFGISRYIAAKLIECGVSAIDIGGMGGTNFVKIEQARNPSPLGNILANWGISTVCSLVEVQQTALKSNSKTKIFASGGVRNGLDCIKLLALGADMVGIAKPLLETVVSKQGYENSISWVNRLLEQMKACMLLVGAKSIDELQAVPLVISGETRNWLDLRGYNLTVYAKRDQC